MNKNSVLCSFMEEHEDWRERLTKDYGIKIKEDPPYAIFNYMEECDFTDPLVQEARGIIIDTGNLEVVCWPFRKFGNYNESYADQIDWKTARVQDKIDGSIIKLWYNNAQERWQFSTNSMIDAGKAYSMTEQETYLDIVKEAENYSDIRYEMLDKNCAYIFELVGPKNQVVIPYLETRLYHIGTRNITTGKELCADIGVTKPKEYPLQSLEDCKRFVEKLNQSTDGRIHSIHKEGFVVVDGSWNRIKIKSLDYCMLHHLVSCTKGAKERMVELLRGRIADIADICKRFSNLAHYFKYYDYKVTEFEYQAGVFIDLVRRVYAESKNNRKAVAIRIKDHRFAAIGFQCLETEKTAKEILEEMPIDKYCRYIPDYVPERMAKVFYGTI